VVGWWWLRVKRVLEANPAIEENGTDLLNPKGATVIL